MARAKGDVTKADMIRDALRQAPDASPKDIQRYIADKYKTTISTTMISSYKSGFKRKSGRGTGDGMIGYKDLRVLRDLIDRVGESELKSVITVLAK